MYLPFQFQISISRLRLAYVTTYYFPLILIVALAWISFFVEGKNSGARALISLLPITLLLLYSWFTHSLKPQWSAFSILDIHTGICYVYTIVAAFVFAVVVKLSGKNEVHSDDDSEAKFQSGCFKSCSCACTIDWICKITFPLSFVALNVLFGWFIMYLKSTDTGHFLMLF